MTEAALLDAIYAAAVDPNGWEGALHALRGAFRSEGANVELSHRSRGPVLFRGVNLAGVDDYLAHYRNVCPRFALLNRSASGTVIHDAMIGAESELDRSEFYADFLRTHGLRYHAAAALQTSGGRLGYVAVQRSRGAGPMESAELALFRRLVPHLDRALRVSTTLAQQEQRNRDFRGALNAMPTGVLLLDAQARVIFANESASHQLDGRGALLLSRRELRARLPGDRKTLRRQLQAGLGDDGPSPATVAYGGHATSPMRLTLTPLPSARRFEAFAELVEGAVLLATVATVDEPWRVRAEDLRGLEGLTMAEAEVVAAIANGLTPRDYAERSGLSLHTVRSYMRQARARLGCHTQAQLVRRVLAYLR